MISSTPRDRSAARLVLLVAEERVDTNPVYTRRDVTGDGVPETWCNLFVTNVARRMGCPLPVGMRANEIVTWLSGADARGAGWEQVPQHVAQRMADEGQLAIPGWFNRNGGPGHVGVVMPSLGEEGVFLAQAGRTNFTRERLERGFGDLQPTFFAHP
jgi:hypothetical protein